MYIVNTEKNLINEIKQCSFGELGFHERENLQEWIAHNPKSLCTGDDELLIIQKEFDGFNDTNERLDLLALDKNGALVVIENKLDDTGKDVVWQALKYVSYCSTLTSEQIKNIYQQYLDKYYAGQNATDNIVDFFGGKPFDEIPLNQPDQRMILVAANFRKEVTSTVMWMLNHDLKVQCFRVTPYQYNGDVFLDVEQIIPVKETEDYIIKMAEKNREVDDKVTTKKIRGERRREFWTVLLNEYRKIDSSYDNVNPTDDHWLSHGAGVSGCVFSFCFTESYANIELCISNGNAEKNKTIFDLISKKKMEIEQKFGSALLWERLDSKISSRISYRLENVSIKNSDDWQKTIAFLCEHMPKFISILKPALIKASSKE